MEQEITGIRDKVEFYMDNNIKIHVSLKDGAFLNGVVLKKLRENVYWVKEDKLGQVFLFLRDIDRIKEFKEKEE